MGKYLLQPFWVSLWWKIKRSDEICTTSVSSLRNPVSYHFELFLFVFCVSRPPTECSHIADHDGAYCSFYRAFTPLSQWTMFLKSIVPSTNLLAAAAFLSSRFSFSYEDTWFSSLFVLGERLRLAAMQRRAGANWSARILLEEASVRENTEFTICYESRGGRNCSGCFRRWRTPHFCVVYPHLCREKAQCLSSRSQSATF